MTDDGTRRMPTLQKPDPTGEVAQWQPDRPGDGQYQPLQRGRSGTGRFWSHRRLPALLVGLLVLGASGLFLYDIVRVRAGQEAAEWRRTLADELATRRLDDTLVVVAAVAAVLLGLWLLVLALTPGLRALLTMRGEPRVRAGVERSAAALVLRDRAMEVPGVRNASVKVRRSRARARVVAHFRDLDTVRREVGEALEDGVQQLGLARDLRVVLRIDRPPRQ